MSYTSYDFSESLNRVHIASEEIETVIAAWGAGDGQGEDTGNGYSENGVTDWAGGFLFKLKDGRFAYVSGWCDFTGWGCQDGADVQYFDFPPPYGILTAPDTFSREPHDWDESPIDLNKWLAEGGKDL